MSVVFVIVALALVFLARWRRGAYCEGAHHSHARRTGGQAFGVGLVHGMGGTAGVGLLLLATIRSHTLAVVALALFAVFTAVSMTLLSTGPGDAARRPSTAGSISVASAAWGPS